MSETFGKKIRRIRDAACMTQREVYLAANLSAGFYSDVENDKRGVSADTLYRLARVFGCSMDELYCGEGPRAIEKERRAG